jgi:uncharacterized protein (TIGR02466 family)
MERNLQMLFPSSVQITDLDADQARALNAKLLRGIERVRAVTPNGRPKSWASTVYTTLNSADQLHQMDEFAELHQIILRESGRFADILHIDHRNFPLRVSDCWFNIYGPKDGQEIHNHANNIISGSYYVKAPEGCSGLMFHSMRYDLMLSPPLTGLDELNQTVAELGVREGRMVLFPSWLKHSVRPSPNADERISISFNVAM